MPAQGPAVTLLALACCCASAARADWKYTKWGMTPQQVVDASNNLAKAGSDPRPDSDGNVSRLVAPHRSGQFSFQAEFGFDAADTLASVTLVLTDKSATMDMHENVAEDPNAHLDRDRGNCRDLQLSARSVYGPPQGGGLADMLYSIETWRDEANANDVKYTVLVGVGCYIQYSAIKRPTAR